MTAERTPRTESFANELLAGPAQSERQRTNTEWIAFARQLERELRAAQKELAWLRPARDSLSADLKGVVMAREADLETLEKAQKENAKWLARAMLYEPTLEAVQKELSRAHAALDTAGVAKGAFGHSVRYRIGLLIERTDELSALKAKIEAAGREFPAEVYE